MRRRHLVFYLVLALTALAWVVSFRGTRAQGGAYRTYLPTVRHVQEFDPSLQNFVGTIIDGGGNVLTLRLDNSPLREVFGHGGARHVTSSRNGERLFVATGTSAWLVDHDGTHLQRLEIPGTSFVGRWSPDSERLFIGTQGGYLVNRNGTELLQLPVEGTVNDASWSPDGSRLFIETAQRKHYLASREGTEVTELPIEGDALALRWSPDNRRLIITEYSAGVDGRYGVLDTLTGTYRPIEGAEFTSSAWVENIEWSPDGSSIVYTKDSEPSQSNTWMVVYATHADGSGVRRLVLANSPVVFEEWLYDGQQFLARIGGNENTKFAVYRADGSLIAELATEHGVYFESISDDKMRFIYRDGRYMYVFDLHNSTSTRISPLLCLDSEICSWWVYWSPSSGIVAYGDDNRYDQSPSRTFIAPLTPTPQVPTEPYILGNSLTWWLTDRFITDNGRLLANLETGRFRELFPQTSDDLMFYGWKELPDE